MTDKTKDYTVQPGRSVRVRERGARIGRSVREGGTVTLSDKDAERLLATGTVKPAKADKTTPPANPLAAHLEGNVGKVVDALKGLSDEDLVAVAILETEDQGRKGVLTAIEAIQASRKAEADAKAAAGEGG
jgi:hypothetical protein